MTVWLSNDTCRDTYTVSEIRAIKLEDLVKNLSLLNMQGLASEYQIRYLDYLINILKEDTAG